MEDGYLAGLDQIRLDQSRNLTLASFVKKFAPPHENPTEQIIQQYAKALGVSPDTPLSQIQAEELIVPMLMRESSTRIKGQAKPKEKTQAMGATEATIVQSAEAPIPGGNILAGVGDLLGPSEAIAAPPPKEAPKGMALPDNLWEEQAKPPQGVASAKPIEQLPTQLWAPEPQPQPMSVEELNKKSELWNEDTIKIIPTTPEFTNAGRLGHKENTWGDLGVDLGLLLGIGLLTNLIAPGAGIVATGAITGALYGTAKETAKAAGVKLGTHRESYGEMITGKDLGPVERIAEDAAFFGLLDKAARPLIHGLKAGKILPRAGAGAGMGGGLASLSELEGYLKGEKGLEDLSSSAKTIVALAGIGAAGGSAGLPVARAAKQVGEKAWDVATIPGKSETFTRIQEALQPAIERLRKSPEAGRQMEADIIRKGRVMQSLTKEEGSAFVRDVKEAGLTFEERWDLTKALSGKPVVDEAGNPLVSTKVLNLYERYSDKVVADTYGKFQEAYTTQLSKLVRGPLSLVDSTKAEAITLQHIQALDTAITNPKSFKEAETALRGLIQDPAVPKATKAFAEDMFNIHHQLPVDIAKAANFATEEHIISDLIKLPGSVVSSPRPGYVKTDHPSLKGMFIDKDLHLELKSMDKLKHEAYGWYQKWFLTPWKTNKVVMRPAAHVRNLIGNLVLNDLGGMPWYRWDLYGRALSEMKNQGKEWKEFRKHVGLGQTFSVEELGNLESHLKYGSTTMDKLLNLFDRMSAPARNLYSMEENWFKLAKFLHNKEQGLRGVDAAMDAMKWTFNYGEVTPLIRKVRTSPFGIPFITFQSKALPLVAEVAIRHPLRLGKWLGLGVGLTGLGLNQLGMSSEEWENFSKYLPDRLQGGWQIPMPYRGEDGNLRLMNFGWLIPGFEEVNSYINTKNPLSNLVQSPLVSTLGALSLNKKPSGAPIYYDWEAPDTKAMKTISYLWQVWSPSGAPGNYDWKVLEDAIYDRPDSLTPMEATLAQFGFRVSPVNEAATYKRYQALQKIHEAEANQQMRSEFRRSASQEEREKIIRKWSEAMKGIKTPELED
jgi:hypothetical protein